MLAQCNSQHFKVHAFDLSKHAINLINEQQDARVSAHVWNIANKDDAIPTLYEQIPADLVTCIFVLSAISPHLMPLVVQRLYKCMKPGAYLFIRDYSINDLAHTRFQYEKDGFKKIDENFYARGDGTQVVFFTTEQITDWFTLNNQFKLIDIQYCKRNKFNQKEQVELNRVFVQATFQKL